MNLAPVNEAAQLRNVFAAFPSGVVALSAMCEEGAEVLVASAFTVGVSLEPPLVMCAIQNTSQTWRRLSACQTLGVSILSTEDRAIVRQLAGSDRAARLVHVDTTVLDSGAVLIGSASTWLECSPTNSFPAGDHTVITLEVLGSAVRPASDALVWYQSGFFTPAPFSHAS